MQTLFVMAVQNLVWPEFAFAVHSARTLTCAHHAMATMYMT